MGIPERNMLARHLNFTGCAPPPAHSGWLFGLELWAVTALEVVP